jgi:hypothetical protein
LRLHRLEAGGFGIEADQLGGVELVQPALQRGFVEDRFVAAFDRCAVARMQRSGIREGVAGSTSAKSPNSAAAESRLHAAKHGVIR